MDREIAQIPNESNEVKVTFTVVLNASISWLERPTKNNINYHLVACIILASLALTAIAINACVLVAIVYSSSLKKVILNQLVSVVSAACVLDCIINIPFSLYCIKVGEWLLGVKVCTTNAVFVLLISFIITWSVCGMCVERWYSISKRNKCRLFTVCKQVVAIAIPLTLSIISLLPVVLGLIEVRLFPDRFMCSIAIKKERCYRTIILLCFIFPITLGLLALLSSLIKNFTKVRNISLQRGQLSYAELFFEESHLWNEWQNCKFVGIITLLFFALELPFIISQTIYTSESSEYSRYLHQNSTSNDFLPLTQSTSTIDRVYSWSKFLFCLVFPLVTLTLRKDIRRKFSSMVPFCKPYSSVSSKKSNESTSARDESPDDFLVPQVWRRRRLSSVTSLTTPIVFGKSKVANSQFQLLDFSAGMAKWKASYEESKRIEKLSRKRGRTFFDDAFEDEEEFTEFVGYEDGTEDEINSSEDFKGNTNVKEVAVQTNDKCFQNAMFPETSRNNSSYINFKSIMEKQNSLEKRRYKNRNRRLSKSFTSYRSNSISSDHKNYLTYPKISSNVRIQSNLHPNMTTSDLLKALKAYRSKKSLTACALIPRSTTELMDVTSESKNIVSL
ncbi:g_PROTEIN_RECEP_F1_2 domain-containing protein [Trichonephila inaurata madagascariensis]|uniref:G_PROTEIN_RECEP_F1_2 domain-containing protein n=1 Tax=Trichonephila inaurata madagascariensis TaxID=2747483 RepID=A0A8X6WRB9_9ARAC|nr:g_PROTEIN_RECEP_F1_2 domain-containing protein [Trichonephila inaurata madagascariensis]